MVPIVEEPLPQENMAPKIEVSPTIVEPNVPIIEESLPKESIALGTKTTLPTVGPEVVTPAATAIKSEMPAIDPSVRPVQFSSLQMLTKGNP